LKKGAEVCALYLRNMPANMPGRQQAAQLALVLAQELQDQVAAWPYSGREGKVVYEAMLFGTGEDPDSVAQVALEIAGRRPEPNHAMDRREHAEAEAAERQEAGGSSTPKSMNSGKPLSELCRAGLIFPAGGGSPFQTARNGVSPKASAARSWTGAP
jgi:hypothetical protein